MATTSTFETRPRRPVPELIPERPKPQENQAELEEVPQGGAEPPAPESTGPEVDNQGSGAGTKQPQRRPTRRTSQPNTTGAKNSQKAGGETYKISFEVDAGYDVELTRVLAGKRWSYGRKVGKAEVLRACLLAVLDTVNLEEMEYQSPDDLKEKIRQAMAAG